MFGSIDPFVEIFLCKKNNESVIESQKTPTIKKVLNQFNWVENIFLNLNKNSNPVYNIDFILNVIPNEHKLLFDVINENRIVS